MSTLRQVVRGSLWVGAGGVAMLVAGCAGMPSHGGTITLSGSQQVPPVTTAATGTSDISANGYRSIFGSVTTSGVVGTAAHIHVGAVGKTGGVAVPLTKKGDNMWVVPPNTTLSEAQYNAYLNGELYVNVHSDKNKPGELRGQVKW